MKKWAVKTIALILSFSLIPTSSAHVIKQGGTVIWGENSGWIVDEDNHTNSTTVLYKFDETDPYVNSATGGNYSYRGYAVLGAARWTNNTIYTVSQSSSAVGVVGTFNNVSPDAFIAWFHSFDSNILGHLTEWEISMNRAKMPNDITKAGAVMAHEFGHAFGLRDLYETRNRDKLMYGHESRTATIPQTADLQGMSVIMGQHGIPILAPHNFNRFIYNPYYYPTLPNTHHVVRYSDCNGDRVSNPIVAHTWSRFVSVTATHHIGYCICGVGSPVEFPHVFVNNVCRDCGRQR